MKKSLVVIVVAWAFATNTSFVHAIEFTRQPFIQNSTSQSVDIRFVTDTQEDLVIKYGETINYGNLIYSTNYPGTGGNNNHFLISSLKPGKTYYYQITTSGGTPLTPQKDRSYFFKTAPNENSPFSWAAWGDSGEYGKVNIEALKSAKPDLVLISGDVGYNYTTDFANNNYQLFDVYKDISRHTPFYPTCGNHEESCETLLVDHTLPGGGTMGGQLSTYSWDYGNVHFTALNSNDKFTYLPENLAASDPQMIWAHNDIKTSKATWKVVYWHHSGWSGGSHTTDETIVNNMLRMASDAGANIVIWGHSHTYERWNKKQGFFPNVQVFTVGTGGKTGLTNCTKVSPGPGCAAKITTNKAGFLLATVEGENMTLRFINEDSQVVDTVTLSSDKNGDYKDNEAKVESLISYERLLMLSTTIAILASSALIVIFAKRKR